MRHFNHSSCFIIMRKNVQYWRFPNAGTAISTSSRKSWSDSFSEFVVSVVYAKLWKIKASDHNTTKLWLWMYKFEKIRKFSLCCQNFKSNISMYDSLILMFFEYLNMAPPRTGPTEFWGGPAPPRPTQFWGGPAPPHFCGAPAPQQLGPSWGPSSRTVSLSVTELCFWPSTYQDLQ